jgi:hypothetical protein
MTTRSSAADQVRGDPCAEGSVLDDDDEAVRRPGERVVRCGGDRAGGRPRAR